MPAVIPAKLISFIPHYNIIFSESSWTLGLTICAYTSMLHCHCPTPLYLHLKSFQASLRPIINQPVPTTVCCSAMHHFPSQLIRTINSLKTFIYIPCPFGLLHNMPSKTPMASEQSSPSKVLILTTSDTSPSVMCQFEHACK